MKPISQKKIAMSLAAGLTDLNLIVRPLTGKIMILYLNKNIHNIAMSILH